ncbi:MAG: hypothetical protein PWQ63_1450 [Methanolobus sp.]|nr:hypothetical protein [Methanolobus sp.]
MERIYNKKMWTDVDVSRDTICFSTNGDIKIIETAPKIHIARYVEDIITNDFSAFRINLLPTTNHLVKTNYNKLIEVAIFDTNI